jgi:hypothetical protein
LVGTDELRAALASSVLPPSTLVWREGMKEWAPAFTMPELASAAISAAREGRAPGEGKVSDEATPTEVMAEPPGKGPGRGELRTLVGMSGPEGNARQSAPIVPIVVPAAGGNPAPSGREVITQLPRYGATPPQPDPDAPVIPPAPRVPTAKAEQPAVRSRTKTMQGTPPSPRRKGTSDIDSLWAVPTADESEPAKGATRDDEEATLPRESSKRPPHAAASATDGTPKVVATPIVADPAPGRATLRDQAFDAPLPLAPKKDETADTAAIKKSTPPPPLADASKPAPAAKTPELAKRASDEEARPAPQLGRKTLSSAPPPPPRRPSSAPPSTARVEPAALAAKAPLKAPPTGFGASKGDEARLDRPAQTRTPPPAQATKPAAAKSTSSALATPIPGAARDGGKRPQPAATVTQPLPTKRSRPTPPVRPKAVLKDADELLEEISVDEDLALAEATTAPAPAVVVRTRSTPAAAQGTEKADDKKPAAPEDAPAKVASSPPLAEKKESAAPTAGAAAAEGTAAAAEEPLQPPPARRDDAGSRRPPARDAAAARLRSDRPPMDAAARPSSRPKQLDEPVSVPVSSLLGAGGALIFMVITAFFVGRCSAAKTARLRARPTLRALPAMARAAVPSPPKPCWVARQPSMWASRASKSIPFELAATSTGSLMIGYARDESEAVGLVVNPTSGETAEKFGKKTDDSIERVIPVRDAKFTVVTSGTGGSLKSPFQALAE